VSIERLIRRFSTRHVMPVQVDEVLKVLIEWGVKDDICFFDAEMDTSVIKGEINHWEAEWGEGTIKRFADITTEKNLSKPEKRLIECKELLHILDPDWSLVSTEAAIHALIEKIVISPELQDPFGDGMEHANSDRVAMLHAVAVLFPWEVRQTLLPAFSRGLITTKLIAEQIADLPEKYVATVMSDGWPNIYSTMTRASRFAPVYDKDGSVSLYDIYIDQQWMGSRRTLQQCEDEIDFLLANA
jgi:hypothetical protein